MFGKRQMRAVKKNSKGQTGKVLLWRVGFFVAVLLLCFATRLPLRAKEKVIRVGTLAGNNYIEEMSGVYHGYGVEYLEEIGKYNGWTYEYVFDTWENCIKLLEAGEVDILCNVQKTEERLDKYLYSSIPVGYDYSIIYAHPDSEIYYEDYEAMKGKKVGLLKESAHSKTYLSFDEKMELDSEPVYYELEDDMIDALKNGETDLAVTGSIYSTNDMKAVGRFGTTPFYIVMTKDKSELMEELDSALQHIKVENPGIEASLANKYYGDSQISSSPLFTKEEHEYIQSRGPVRVTLMEDVKPLSYEDETGKRGIFISYLDLLSDKTGLSFEVEIQRISDKSNMADGQTDLMFREKLAIEGIGLEEGYVISNPIVTIPLSYWISKDKIADTGRDDYVFAVTHEMRYFEDMVKNTSENFKVKYFDTSIECFDAVKNGEADIGAQNSYVVSYLLQRPKYAEKLVECPGQQCLNGFCLVASQEDKILIQILNKAINYISEEERTSIATAELLMVQYDFTLADLIYRYWKSLLFAACFVLLLIATYTVLMRRMTKLEFQKKEYELLRKKVQQDELTGVYNRPAFYKKAKKMIDNATEDMYIVLMDISNFKVVNDLYGISVGDKLLIYMAKELSKIGENKEFVVGRFNSDHFYMCMKASDFERINFPKRYKTFLEDIDVTVIYGVYPIRDKSLPINIMCDRASLAAHDEDRKRGEYIRYYSDEERKKLIKEQEVVNDVEKALESRQFVVYVQPKYNIYEDEIIGGEALVRWCHPQKGMVPPMEFIPILEKNGFIVQLDYYVWEETCRLIADLKKKGYGKLPISVNVSRAHFYGKELREKLEELIEKYSLEPDDIELEITETICAEDPDIIYKKIEELQKFGFKIAMDDFGSGYSSLNMLKEIPLDILKMDLKFLSGGDNTEKSHNILKTLILLAKSINLFVVVEGVETEEQVEFLREVGCRYAQGYYYSRPIDCLAFEKKLGKVE